MAKVLVVGGAGYVGGTACAWLLDRGHHVWILDDLSTGHREWLPRLSGVDGFTLSRAGDTAQVKALLKQESFDCVMHFAAKALVGESVEKPDIYFENNVQQTEALLEAMLECGTRKFIFSSTCAIFGDPGPSVNHMNEEVPKNPINPYGETKLQVERILDRLAREKGLQAIALRYFNAAGAESGLRVGEWHDHETHLIPRLLQAALRGDPVEIFGTDYPTADGTCVRDYVHVWDLAQAHGAAMERLLKLPSEGAGRFEAYNLGSENGFSVREMIQACERTVGFKLKVKECPRRPGDPPRLVADARKAREVLGFGSSLVGLDQIFASAWTWEQHLRQARQKASGLKRAVFLDRDGTLNEDPGYLNDPGQLRLLPQVGEALSLFKKAGFELVVVSNQSGVARGLIRPEVLPKIHSKMDELLKPYGVSVSYYALCLHHPDEGCSCRKPKPKLIIDAAAQIGIDLSRSFMVGDKLVDIQAGRNAGCRAVSLVRTGYGAEVESRLLPHHRPEIIGDSLLEVARWILAQENASP